MVDKKIGCSAGRTILIDPNSFDGQDSMTNISVPLEDLSISVQLETTKRARTVLTSNGIKNIGVSSNGAKIKFIGGSDVSGEKVLTTRYTDLTTSLDGESNDGESLGITSIDIDFNSSYAPMVVINFVDLRGSSVFQNEAYISSGKNKYASFFQLPYPIFTLTIKGYYGMPVKYDLHMTKFNAKFNSKTGNFEITANFIGYTYAMLSDMLLGYLKAIPYTELGAAKYNKIKQTRPDLLTLDELVAKISEIDSEAKKLKSSDEGVSDLTNAEKKRDILSVLSVNLLNFGQDIDNKNDLNQYKFIIPKKDADVKKATDSYNTNITENIKQFNLDNKITIDDNDFSVGNMNLYKNLSLRLLNPAKDLDTNDSRYTDANKTETLRGIFKTQSDDELIKTRNEIFNYAKRYGITTEFDVYDLRKQYQIINDKDTALVEQIKNLKKSLGEILRLKVKDTLGLDPSVRNIISIFTASVEVLMSVLFEVSQTAISTDKKIREAQLKKFGPSVDPTQPNSFDIKFNSINPLGNTNTSGSMETLYYPWPEYRKNDAIEGLVDTYLGEPGILDIPQDVTELRFIDDLLNAFLTSKKKNEEVTISEKKDESHWFPINPIDTKLFVNNFPYKRISGNSKNDVINLLLDRAFIYLGISNVKLAASEIQAIASSEVSGILSDISNDVIIQSLSQLKPNDFYDATAKNLNLTVKMMKYEPNFDSYYYNFILGSASNSTNFNVPSIPDARGEHYLPINNLSNDKFEFNIGLNSKKDAQDGNIFLSNYSTTPYLGNGVPIEKPDDGGIYIKIIKPEIYNGSASQQLPQSTNNDNVLDLAILRKSQEQFNNDFSNTGFKQFGGKFGIQEYKTLNFGTNELGSGEYRLMFYQDSNYSPKQLVKSNSLCNKRTNKTTQYDISGSTYQIIESSVFDSALDNGISIICGDDATHTNLGKNRVLLSEYIKNKSNTVTHPYVSFQIAVDTDDSNFGDSDDSAPVGLFGSRLYYEQKSQHAKALLFLHTLSWNGFYKSSDGDAKGIFSKNEIINTFGSRAGFVSVPRLWAAFIGGLLWRADNSAPQFYPNTSIQIGGGSGAIDPIIFENNTESFIPTYSVGSTLPTRLQYLTAHFDSDFQSAPMIFPSVRFYVLKNRGFKDIEDLLLQLPDQAKNEFKNVFLNFVENNENHQSDWTRLRSELEVIDSTQVSWKDTWNQIMQPKISGGGLMDITKPGDLLSSKFLDADFIRTKFSATSYGNLVFNSYMIFSPYYGEQQFDYNFITELRDDSNGVREILDLMSQELIIANSSYKIWQQKLSTDSIFSSSVNFDPREGVYVKKSDLDLFVNTVIDKLKVTETNPIKNKQKQRQQEIFGTDNENLIKLQLYRTCKNIYDKWIGGTESEDTIFFRDGNENRNGLDKQLALKANRRENDLALIDSFRFVSRSFKDIGDSMIINPLPVSDFLTNNPNSSFYDCVTNLLTTNNFDFIALPSYINYGDPELLQSIFKPISSQESFSNGTIGPSFVCVYTGQPSKHLDFADSEYEDDGIQFRCDSDGNLTPSFAKDFYSSATTYENNVAVFAVNYSQQNQNIFKDITLDQSEFSETAESLQITDDIARRGSENRKTFGGQNMYNVYSVRSYRTEVEMMGNAMIQPMMYFQLNNIPMFHGAYLITQVKHSIKPNSMSTVFSGVRIRNIETPILDASELFMSLIDSIEGSSTSNDGINTNVSSKLAYAPIIRTIIENGGVNGNITSKNIQTKTIITPQGIKNFKPQSVLLSEAVDPLNQMLSDWVKWMKQNNFIGNSGNYAYITSVFRTYEEQVAIRNTYGASSANPGQSNHGWGIAIDLQFFRKNGLLIDNYKDGSANLSEGYNFSINESIVWLLDNSYSYGWIIPEELRDDSGLEEFWHFEYHGKSAACILAKRPIIKGRVIDTSLPYKGNVKNPLGNDGNEAIYLDCEYNSVGKLDGITDVILPANPNIQINQPNQTDIIFYSEILNRIGAKPSPENLKFMYAWRQAEGANAAWNPLNITYQLGNWTPYSCTIKNSPYVLNYADKENGLKATVATLTNGFYTDIVNGLRNDIGSHALSTLIKNLTTWGTGYGINKILAGGVVNPPPISTSQIVVKNCS